MERSYTLPYNIEVEADRAKLQLILNTALVEDKQVHRNYYEEWNEIDDRLNGDTTPIGFSDQHTQLLALRNAPQSKMEKILEFVPLNRVRPNHESVMGMFTAIRRRLTIVGKQPIYRNIARVFQERIQYIEDVEMLPEKVYFPAQDWCYALGTSWIKLTYNPKANRLRGKFDISAINTRDVIVGKDTRGVYYSEATRIHHRVQYDRDTADLMFSKYPLYNSKNFSPDIEYMESWRRKDGSNSPGNMATFYETHMMIPTHVYYFGNPTSNYYTEIDEDTYYKIKDDPQLGSYAVDGEMELRYYILFSNPSMGVFHFQRNELDCITLFPLLNIQSSTRLYGIGDIKLYAQLNDLLEVLVTVFLENAKKANTPVIPVDAEVDGDKLDEVIKAAKYGGPAPGGRGVYYAPPISQGLSMLIPWVLSWIQDAVSQHSASMGEMPAKQIAKETIQTLIAKDTQSHGRKPVMLRYTLTMLAKGMVKMINLMEDQPEYFDSIDPKPYDFKTIPINQTWSEQEYTANIASMVDLPMPQGDEQVQVFQQMITELRKKFEAQNDVKVRVVDGFVVGGVEMTPERFIEFSEYADLPWEEFIRMYQPVPTKIRVYEINDMTQDIDFKVSYGIDEDYENDKQYRANKAIMLHDKGIYGRLELAKDLGVMNPEQSIADADAENQAMMLAKALAANPQAMQIAQQMISDPNFMKQFFKPQKSIPQPTQ
jgi:hypothetical protein